MSSKLTSMLASPARPPRPDGRGRSKERARRGEGSAWNRPDPGALDWDRRAPRFEPASDRGSIGRSWPWTRTHGHESRIGWSKAWRSPHPRESGGGGRPHGGGRRRRLPVVDGDELLGMISDHDIARHEDDDHMDLGRWYRRRHGPGRAPLQRAAGRRQGRGRDGGLRWNTCRCSMPRQTGRHRRPGRCRRPRAPQRRASARRPAARRRPTCIRAQGLFRETEAQGMIGRHRWKTRSVRKRGEPLAAARAGARDARSRPRDRPSGQDGGTGSRW